MKSFCLIVFLFLFAVSGFSQQKKKLVTFRFSDNSKDQVYLSGDFNSWNPRSHPMYKKNGKWHLSLELTQGYHYFTYITKTNIMPDPDHPLIVDNKLNKFMSVIKVGNPEYPKRYKPEIKLSENYFPKIIFDEKPSLEIIFNHSRKMLVNYFYSVFSGNNISEQKFSPLFALSASYFPDVIPVGKFLDIFYESEYVVYNNPENAINCAFLPYCEFRYFQITGDDSRFKAIFPQLIRKYELLFRYVQNEIKTKEKNFEPHNLNRIKYSPVFLKSLQALYLKYLTHISGIIDDEKNTALFVSKYVALSDNINNKYLKKGKNSYYDKWEDGKSSHQFHSGMLITILAEVCPKYVLKSVKNSFSATDYFYPIYNYLYCSGLKSYYKKDEISDLSSETLTKIIDAYNNCLPVEKYLNLNERYNDSYVTLWNSYSAVVNSPMIFDESQQYALQNDLLTAGPGFFNMVLEHFMGIELAGNENIIRWQIRNRNRNKQGVKNLKFRNQKIDLIISQNENKWYLDVKCKTPFKLELNINGSIFTKTIDTGYNSMVLK